MIAIYIISFNTMFATRNISPGLLSSSPKTFSIDTSLFILHKIALWYRFMSSCVFEDIVIFGIYTRGRASFAILASPKIFEGVAAGVAMGSAFAAVVPS